MTQDEIIRMAREAGYQSVYLSDAPIGRSYLFLERFASLVAAHEREKQAKQEPVAIKQLPDPYDDRDGVWFDAEGLQRLKALPPGTKLYVAPVESVKQEPGFYGRAAARLSQRVKELELEQSGKWRDHVEHRMLTWKTSHMNESGDQLSLKDFMDEHILDDLIDFVCDEYTARTKDLTDDEIAMCMGKDLWNVYKNEVDFARAVITKFKEKNK